MTVYLPTPYDDELLYSVIARYFVHSGVKKTFARTSMLLDSSPRIDALMVSRLDAFVSHVAPMEALRADRVLYGSTLFPYATSALPPARMKSHAHSIYTGDSQSAQAMNILLTKADRRPTLHYCEACVQEDTDRHGETYWRRAHQLILVTRCPLHKLPLTPSTVPVQGYGTWTFVDATAATQAGSVADTPARELKAPIFDDLAAKAVARLDGHVGSSATDPVISMESLLAKRGFACTVDGGDVTLLAAAMLDFYGDAVLGILGATKQTDIEWALKSTLNRKRLCKPPTLDLLLRTLLEAAGEGDIPPETMVPRAARISCSEPRLHEPGTGVDDVIPADVGATHEKRCDSGTVVRKGSKKGPQYRKPSPTDLSGMRSRWLEAVRDAAAPRITNAVSKDQTLYRTLMEHDRAWMIEAKQAIYKEYGGKLYRGELRKPRSDDDARLRERQRDAWLEALKNAQHPKWYHALKVRPTLYRGLMATDREWMAKVGRTFKTTSAKSRGVFGKPWAVIDCEMLNRLEELLSLMGQKGAVLNLNRRTMAAAVGLNLRSMGKVPLTMARIDQFLKCLPSRQSL